MSVVAPRVHWLTDESATGPIVLLAHGLEDGWRSWQPLVRVLDPGWRLCALDLPWRAGGGYAWRHQGMPGDWIGAALAELPDPIDVLVGHSFGANAVLHALASGVSPAPLGAMLVAPFYCPPELEITWAVYDRARHDFDLIIRQGLELRLGARMSRLDPALVESILAKMVDKVGPIGFTTLFDQFVATADLSLADVTVPTLILAGGQDPSLDVKRAAALRRGLPDAQVVLEPTFDHFCQVRRVDLVARHLSGFVEKICAAREGGTW